MGKFYNKTITDKQTPRGNLNCHNQHFNEVKRGSYSYEKEKICCQSHGGGIGGSYGAAGLRRPVIR